MTDMKIKGATPQEAWATNIACGDVAFLHSRGLLAELGLLFACHCYDSCHVVDVISENQSLTALDNKIVLLLAKWLRE